MFEQLLTITQNYGFRPDTKSLSALLGVLGVFAFKTQRKDAKCAKEYN